MARHLVLRAHTWVGMFAAIALSAVRLVASAAQTPATTVAPLNRTLLASGPGWSLQSLAGNVGTVTLTAEDQIYILYGVAGIANAPLSQSVSVTFEKLLKDQMLADARRLQPDQQVYVLHKPALISAENLHKLVNPQLYPDCLPEPYGCHGQSENASVCTAAYAEKDKALALNVSVPPMKVDTSMASPFAGLFEGDLTFQASAAFRNPKDSSKGLGGQVKLRVGEVFCVPVWIRPVNVSLWAHADISATFGMNGTLKLSKTSEPLLLGKLFTYEYAFMLGPVPVVVIIDAPIEAAITVGIETPTLTTFLAQTGLKTGFDVTCKFGGHCTNNTAPYLTNSSATPLGSYTFNATGRAFAKPFLWMNLRASLYESGKIYVKVGPRVYVNFDMWGASQKCGDADKDGAEEWVQALTLDTDAGVEIVGEVGLMPENPLQNPILSSIPFTLWQKNIHLNFIDLMSTGGSKGLQPILDGPSSVTEDASATFSASMRPCYPYKDKVQYTVNWGDQTPQTQIGARAQSVMHAWQNPGTYSVRLLGLKDTHGRDFENTLGQPTNPVSFTRTVMINAPGATPKPSPRETAALSAPAQAADDSCCSIVANPALRNRMGRLMVTYPQRVDPNQAVMYVYDAGGKYLHKANSSAAIDLMPGTYAVAINNKRVDHITILAGHDTHVKVGVLRLSVGDSTRVYVYDADQLELTRSDGKQDIGFPIGTVYVDVAGQSQPLKIEEGKITAF